MAFKKVQVTPTELYTLERKGLSKLLHTLPAVSDEKSMEEMAPKTAYWPIYTLVQAKLAQVEDAGDRLINLFTRNLTAAELRKGFVHTETGRAVAHVWKSSLKPGDVLDYKVHEWKRIFEEVIDEDPVQLCVPLNTKLFQYVEGFTDPSNYQAVMNNISSDSAVGLKDAMKKFLYSLIIGFGHKMFVKNYYIDAVWNEDIKLSDETESKEYKNIHDKTKEFYKLCKQAAGEFQAKFKNVRYFDPSFDTTHDWERKGTYDIKPLTSATSKADVKTKILERYALATDNENNKKKPVKWITRDQCIWSMVSQIVQAVDDLTRIPAVENWMEYDPYATNRPNDKQLPCRSTKEDLVILMNPHDLNACILGAGYTGAGGTAPIRNIANIGVDCIPVDGMLPGECFILDKRSINIIPIYRSLFKNFNGYHLVDQTFAHLHFKWGVFRYFAGVKLIATKWCPHAAWISEFQKEYIS